MTSYEVVLSLGASASMYVDADSAEEAIQIAQDEFWDDELAYTNVWSVDDIMEVNIVEEDAA
jgi:hypothetical protein